MALYCRCCWNTRSLRGTGECSVLQRTGSTLWSFSSKAKFQANCRSDDGADPSQEEAAKSRKVCWAIGNRSCLRETLEAPGKEERPFRGAPAVDREGEGVIGTRCSLQGGMEGHCPHLHPLRYYGHCWGAGTWWESWVLGKALSSGKRDRV